MTEQTQPEQTPAQEQPAPLAPLSSRIMAKAHNSYSIRYDLNFAEALLRFTDAQLAPTERPTEEPTTLEEAADQRFTYMILADCIDRYAERLVEARLEAAGVKNESGLTGNG